MTVIDVMFSLCEKYQFSLQDMMHKTHTVQITLMFKLVMLKLFYTCSLIYAITVLLIRVAEIRLACAGGGGEAGI